MTFPNFWRQIGINDVYCPVWPLLMKFRSHGRPTSTISLSCLLWDAYSSWKWNISNISWQLVEYFITCHRGTETCCTSKENLFRFVTFEVYLWKSGIFVPKNLSGSLRFILMIRRFIRLNVKHHNRGLKKVTSEQLQSTDRHLFETWTHKRNTKKALLNQSTF